MTEPAILIKNSFLNIFGRILPLIAGVLLIPYAIKGLGKESFGILALVWVIFGYFGLFDFGLSRTTTKFASEAFDKKDNQALRSIFWTAILLSFGLGVVGAIALILVTPLLVEEVLTIPNELILHTKISFFLISITLPIILCSTCLRGVLEANQRFDLVNIVLVPTSILMFVFPGLSYPFHLNLPMVIFLMSFSRAAAGIVYFFICLKSYPILRKERVVDTNYCRKMLAYGGWISITNIVSPLLVYIDRFFIGSFISLTFVSYYSAPYEILVRLRMFPNAIMTTFFPEFSIQNDNPSNLKQEILFAKAVKYILLFVGIVVVGLLLYAKPILSLWLGEEFAENSSQVFRVLAIGVLFNSLALVPFMLLQGVGLPDLPAKFHLVELPVYIALMYWLVPKYSINGAAWAWTIRVLIDAALLFGISVSKYPLIAKQMKNSKIIPIIFYLFSLWFFLYFVQHIFIANSFKIITSLFLFFLFIMILWFFLLDNTEKYYSKLIVSKRRNSHLKI
ncbi:Membrane protein involved in the export of O-antigen and teichoic acid [Candidatus Electrothrix aarhusensis]|uniref:Membrane protein involved in the export of O-antigen and teichoic acid n=1 Tax=Candidatus Electrothrix aarhusensis TaxID=1859131 RepID=A0A444IWS4_9BACT|nr:Membrane protein involved in the export of O-antigen and teichoic acid [Candidatus Electrothrix aarhusensis]